MRNLADAIATGNMIAEVRALGADEATITKPAYTLAECLKALNDRAERRVIGRLTQPMEQSVRHYLLELALMTCATFISTAVR